MSAQFDAQEMDRLNRGRVLRLSLGSLLPMLDEKIEEAMSRIQGDFRSGEKDFIRHAAELTTLRELKDDLLRETKDTEQLEERLNEY